MLLTPIHRLRPARHYRYQTWAYRNSCGKYREYFEDEIAVPASVWRQIADWETSSSCTYLAHPRSPNTVTSDTETAEIKSTAWRIRGKGRRTARTKGRGCGVYLGDSPIRISPASLPSWADRREVMTQAIKKFSNRGFLSLPKESAEP